MNNTFREALSILAMVSILGAFTPAGADDTKPLPCVHASDAPVLDGRLDDACWEAAAAAVRFSVMGSGGNVAAEKQTTVRTAYDAHNLYVAATCIEPEMDRTQASIRARDGSVFDDDCLELWLDVNHDGATSYHFAINSLGTVADGVSDCRKGFRYDRAWNADITTAARRLDDRWMLEMAIPFRALDTPSPTEETLWGFNAAREHRLEGAPTFSTWSALAGRAFHQPEAFSLLRFVGATVRPSLHEVSHLMLALRNPDFSERDTNGHPSGWSLGDNTTCVETAYLSGIYVLKTDSDHTLARQLLDLRGLAGREYQFSVQAKGIGEARLGLVLRRAMEHGKDEETKILDNQPITDTYEWYRGSVRVPHTADGVVSLELRRTSRQGTLLCKGLSVTDPSGSFAGIKDATDVFPAQRCAVEAPFPALGKKWGVPLWGGPLNVLHVADANYGLRGGVELGGRLEMVLDQCWVADGVPLAYGAEKINAKLRGDERPYDAILLCTPIVDKAFLQALRQQIRAGTGLIHIQRDGDMLIGKGLEDVLPPAVALANAPHPLARGIPWSLLPRTPDNGVYSGRTGQPGVKDLGTGMYGKGRVVRLGYGGPGNVRGVLPATGNNPADVHDWWEYAYALVAKSVLHASQRAMPAEIGVTQVDGEILRVNLQAHRLFTGHIALRWEDKYHVADGYDMEQAVVVDAEQTTSAAIPIPDAVRRSHGIHVADIRLKDSRGKTVDWATAILDVKGEVRIDEQHPLGRDWYRDGEFPTGSVRVTSQRATEANLALRAVVVDSYGRCVWQTVSTIRVGARAALDVPLRPDMARCQTIHHSLQVTLLDSQGPLDQRAWDVYLPDKSRGALDDFRSGFMPSYWVRTHTDASFTAWLQQLGFGFASDGSSMESAPSLNLPWHKFFIAWRPFHHLSGTPIRNPCLSDPNALEDTIEKALNVVRHCRKYGPVFYTIGDEVELVRDGKAEVCFSPHCAERFRIWSKELYGNLERANAEWGTEYGSWEDITPVRAGEVRERGNFALWVDFRMFMEDVWIGAFEAVHDAVNKRYPEALLSFSNPFGRNPFSGEDHYKSAMAEDIHCKYLRPDLIKEFRSFNPTTPIHSFYGYLESVPFCRYFPWHFALNGGDVLSWYDVVGRQNRYALFDATGRHTPRSKAVVETTADLITGVGKILRDFPPIPSQVAILHSQTSLHVSWIESGMQVGTIPWAENGMDRLPASNPFGLHHKSRENLKAMLKETSLQPDFLVPERILNGGLDGYRLLILPCSVSLSEQTIAAITEFVQDGGAVLADMRAGLYDEHGKTIPTRPSIESVFGIRRSGTAYQSAPAELSFGRAFAAARREPDTDPAVGKEDVTLTTAHANATHADGTPALMVNAYGKGKAIYLNFVPEVGPMSAELMSVILDVAGVRRSLRLTKGEQQAVGYECFQFARGPIRYVGILRDLLPPLEGERSGWLGPPFRQATPGREAVSLGLSRQAHVYGVRNGEYLGRHERLLLELAPGEAKVLGLLPYTVEAVAIRGVKKTYRPGDALAFEVVIRPDSGSPGDHTLRIEIRDPRGKLSTLYSRNVLARNGSYRAKIPLALNELPGIWTITVSDVTTKVRETARFAFEQAD